MPIWNSEEKIEKISKELLLPDPGGFPGQSDISPVEGGNQRLKKETDGSRLSGGRLTKQWVLLKMLVLFESPDGSVSAPPTRILTSF